MKIVINKCFGGFGLSPLATQTLAKMEGKECFFFKDGFMKPYKSVSMEEIKDREPLFLSAFSVPNPNDLLVRVKNGFLDNKSNIFYKEISINYRDIPRTDSRLIKVIEELGSEKASGRFAELVIIEIPDGIEWEIDEYDGLETIHEKHRSWG